MGDVIRLFSGRRKRGKKIPKPQFCMECDEPIETARIQALDAMFPVPLKTRRKCIDCARSSEARERRVLSYAGPNDIVIIRG
jgi:hypothetical protein